MAQAEKYHTRDQSYSAWHRIPSLSRYIPHAQAMGAGMIDLDGAMYVEYEDSTKTPLLLVETAIDVGQNYKTATVTRKLAVMANLPAIVLLYALSEKVNPKAPEYFDLTGFRVKMLTPRFDTEWVKQSPQEWAETIVKLRAYSKHRLAME